MKKQILKQNITETSSIFKEFTNGIKTRMSLIYTMFKPVFGKKVTKKIKKLENLAYTALKKYPKLGLTVLRRFSLKKLKRDYKKWLKSSKSNKSKKQFKARIDSTKTGRKYAKKMPALKLIYDYVDHCKIRTHVIYLFVVSVGRKDYIVDFKLVRKDNEGLNKIAKLMINRFLRSIGKRKFTLNYLRVSLDGAWGTGNMLHYLSGKGFKYTAIKSGGRDLVKYKDKTYSLKDLERYLSLKTNLFQSFNDCHSLKGDYCSVSVRLISKNIPLRIVLRRFRSRSKDRPYRYLMLLSTNMDSNVRDYQICKCYEGRWGIEECIKENKQALLITRYSFHSVDTVNIENFLCLRFCLYMILDWYRVEHCRPSRTSIYKVCERFKNYFDSISYKSVWELFSG